MHSRVEFEKNEAQKTLYKIIDDFEYPIESNSVEEVNLTLEDIKKVIKDETDYCFARDYKITQKFYHTDSGELDYVDFTVSLKPKKRKIKGKTINVKEELTIEKYKKRKFTVYAGVDFYDNFILELAKFFDGYNVGIKLQENLDELNEAIKSIIEEITLDRVKLEKDKENFINNLCDKVNDAKLRTNVDNLKKTVNFINKFADKIENVNKAIAKIDDKFDKMSDDIDSDELKKKYKGKIDNTIKIFGEDLFDWFKEDKNLFADNFSENLLSSIGFLSNINNYILSEIHNIEKDRKTKHSLSFILDEKHLLIEASDRRAVIGLKEEVIKDLANLPLFDNSFPARKENYKEYIINILNVCKKPFNILNKKKLNSDLIISSSEVEADEEEDSDENPSIIKEMLVVKDLGIYQSTLIHNHLKESVLNRSIENVIDEGVGYFETPDLISLIEKKNSEEDGDIKAKYIFKVKPFNKYTFEEESNVKANYAPFCGLPFIKDINEGVGYYGDGEIWSVIEKTPVSKDIIENNVDDSLLIINNNNNDKSNKEKYKVTFIIKPYNIKSRKYVDLSLREIFANELVD